MRFLMVGTGGLGGYFGARLHAAGNEVIFCARGNSRAALVENGLTVTSGAETIRVEKPLLNDTPEAGGFVDAIIVCTKMTALDGVFETARAYAGPDTMVLSLQNGVEAEDRLAGDFGPGAVIGATARISATLVAPGVVDHAGPGFNKITIGERDSSSSARIDALAAALDVPGIDVEVAADVTLDTWTKFCFMASLSAAACYYRATLGEILGDTEKLATFRQLIEETAAVGRARGVALPDGVTDALIAMMRSMAPEVKPSTLVDLEQGRPLEVEWLSGAVIRLGGETGVATPTHQKIYEALKPHFEGA